MGFFLVTLRGLPTLVLCCGGLFATTQPRARTGKIVLQHNPPESGQIAESGGMSALCQKRPNAPQQKAQLFDRLVSGDEQLIGHGEAEHPGGLVAGPDVAMRESRTYGSVRGALSNGCPYRVQCFLLRCVGTLLAQSRHAATLCYFSAFGGLCCKTILPVRARG